MSRTSFRLPSVAKRTQRESGRWARRRKRSLREAADVYLSLPVSDRRTWNKIARCGVDPEDIDNQMAMIIGLTMAATAGDARAAKVIVDLIGEEDSQGEAGVEIIDDL